VNDLFCQKRFFEKLSGRDDDCVVKRLQDASGGGGAKERKMIERKMIDALKKACSPCCTCWSIQRDVEPKM
jgi:hypothetical protein